MSCSYFPTLEELTKRDAESVSDKLARLISEHQSVCEGKCKNPDLFGRPSLGQLVGQLSRTAIRLWRRQPFQDRQRSARAVLLVRSSQPPTLRTVSQIQEALSCNHVSTGHSWAVLAPDPTFNARIIVRKEISIGQRIRICGFVAFAVRVRRDLEEISGRGGIVRSSTTFCV
jgi:hypothetical protein